MKNKHWIEAETVYFMVNYKGQTKVVNIDLEDFERVNSVVKNKWYYDGKYVFSSKMEQGKRTTYLLHRLIMETPEGLVVDHKDKNTLNNSKSNLRNVTQQVNMWNYTAKNVSYNKEKKKWKAYVHVNRKQKAKYADTYEEAVKLAQELRAWRDSL